MIDSISIPFFEIVQRLESSLGGVTGLELIDLLGPEQYLSIREAVINSFELDKPVPIFNAEDFGDEVEIGDVSDAVREVTFGRYPQNTPMNKPIFEPERRAWCLAIIDDMDNRVRYF